MAEHLYPLTFAPQLKDYIWGGRNLETVYQRPLPPGTIAESWEISGHPDGPTHVDSGPLAGTGLPELVATYGEALVGRNATWALERETFPLLVKLLDANRSLSVQVHPKDEYALANEDGSLGKTEMWYVLHTTRPDARIIFGVAPGTTAENFRQAIEDTQLESRLHYLPVKPGDAIFVEAGSIHAILDGVMIAEIQQSSNITYRVYDWGRVGTDGKSRPLHVEQALAVANFEQVTPGPYPPKLVHTEGNITRAEISRCKYFVVETVDLATDATFHGATNGDSLEIWGTVSGNASLHSGEHHVALPMIRFCLVPATSGEFSVTATEESRLLRIYLP